ncbi:hypothetical protein ALI22I_09040 [Saccharothrix sp. ALI-22-I]|uniref:DUF6319 family protein n=1 Tax=Saccharothrix sp. ALI-22-I TaxID=1933778 RepID=UPI00097C11DB|nr:DUF6319 family protein [Saccharothrix sp. ALI-22-I]ONI91316.1 hypothetical protein ALI22I_09040 [Saccharothrix sp. ALI-22-I]
MAKAKQSSLSPQDIDHLRAELAAGRPPAVWFTSAAVGVEAGRSAKVVAFTEPAEGDFIQVRPTGEKDELSFSPAELTVEKPAPRRRAPTPAAAAEPEAPAPVEHIYTPAPPPAKPKPAPAPASASAQPAAERKPAVRKQAKPAEVTVTLVSTIEGEWTVDVQWGSKRTLKAAPVAASAVSQAAKLLPAEVDEAVESVLSAARERHLARVEQLRAELEAAQRALDELTG